MTVRPARALSGRPPDVRCRPPGAVLPALLAVALVVGCSGSTPTDPQLGRPTEPTTEHATGPAALPTGVTLTPWTDVRPGIRLRRGHAEDAFDLPGTPRPQDLTAVEVDLDTPGLHLVSAPAAGPDQPPRPGHPVHTTGAALSDAVAARPEVVVAVNANFFWPCCALPGGPAVGMTLFGAAVEGGTVVADPAAPQQPPGCPPVAAVPDDGAVGAPALLVGAGNRADLALVTADRPLPAGTTVAVAGGPQPDPQAPPPCGPADGYPPGRPVPGPAFLLHAGATDTVARADPPEWVAARTFVGLSSDGRRLVLATIDGSEHAGAAFHDEASWLALLGATDGLNLDGGGSSSMVLRTTGDAAVPDTPCPRRGDVVLLDRPDNGGPCRERLIGTYLGIAVGDPSR